MNILFTMVYYFLLFSMFIPHSKNKRNWVSVRLCYNRLPYTQGGKGNGGGGYQLRITPIFLKLSRITRITEKINKILTTITSILLSFDLNKIRGRGTKKRVEVGIIAMYFKMSLLLVSKDINHYRNFKGKS